jgi:cysteine synthase A
VEGIGRPRVEASFVPSVIDRMIAVPDAASVAATLWLERLLGRRCGPSTGTNLIGALTLAQDLANTGGGAVATLICDPGDRYGDTIYDPAWRDAQGLDLSAWTAVFDRLDRHGHFAAPAHAPLRQA